MENTRPWNELDRAEKIKHLFDYPESMRSSLVKELWGPEAIGGYREHIYFPPDAPWCEIIEVIKNSQECQTVYMRLTDKDFKVFSPEMEREIYNKVDLYTKREYVAFAIWQEKVLRNSKPIPLDLEHYDENSLVCRVCTKEGDYGDEHGFGMEADMWASAIFDLDGHVIRPFEPGCIFAPQDVH